MWFKCEIMCTYDEAQQFVWQQAGGDEGHQQSHIQLPSQLRLNPHEQTVHTNRRNSTGITASIWGMYVCVDELTSLFSPGYLPASQTDSVRGDWKQLWCKSGQRRGQMLNKASACPPRCPPRFTWALWATSRTSWNFSDTVRSSLGGSWKHQRPKHQQLPLNSAPARTPRLQRSESSPRAQRLQVRCSTESSNLWEQCIMGTDR